MVVDVVIKISRKGVSAETNQSEGCDDGNRNRQADDTGACYVSEKE